MKAIKHIFLAFLAFYGITCFSNVYFVFGPFYEEFGASPRAVGLFLSIFYMAMIICRPLGSFITEKTGVRRTLIGSSIACALSASGIALSLSAPELLLFFRALSGLSVSVFSVATVAYQSMLLDSESRGVGFALFATGGMLPMATVVPLSEWVLKAGCDTLYLWLPVFVSLICLAVGLAIKDTASVSKKEKTWGTYTDMFSVEGVKTLLLTGFFMSLADGSTICAAALASDRGVSVSWFMISASVAAVVVRTVGFNFIDRIPRMLLAAPAACIMGLGLFCMSFSSSSFFFAVFGVVFGLGIGIGFPIDLSIVGDLLPVKFHPKATGCLLLAIDSGWAVTPLIYGFISPVLGASGAFRMVALFVMAASSAVFFMLWIPLMRRRKIII